MTPDHEGYSWEQEGSSQRIMLTMEDHTAALLIFGSRRLLNKNAKTCSVYPHMISKGHVPCSCQLPSFPINRE
jgi:hypothetical protein